jgi:hypothetical protein
MISSIESLGRFSPVRSHLLPLAIVLAVYPTPLLEVADNAGRFIF